jgi:hypothetical protein
MDFLDFDDPKPDLKIPSGFLGVWAHGHGHMVGLKYRILALANGNLCQAAPQPQVAVAVVAVVVVVAGVVGVVVVVDDVVVVVVVVVVVAVAVVAVVGCYCGVGSCYRWSKVGQILTNLQQPDLRKEKQTALQLDAF